VRWAIVVTIWVPGGTMRVMVVWSMGLGWNFVFD
jgi:hypothetical protein